MRDRLRGVRWLVVALLLASRAAWAAPEVDKERLLGQLQSDLQSVEQALEGTRELIQKSMHRPYLPDLYLRLAELYIEKSRFLYHLKRLEDPEASKGVVVLEANLLKTKAIDLYNKILDEFPDYAHRDKVIFFMAHEFRELGQFDNMMRCYTDLVETYPESPYRLETFLLIGDYHFDSMDLDKAEEAYRTILAAPESHVHGMARYKMAWCHINRNRFDEALALLETIVADRRYDVQKTEIDAYKRINLRREALMDLAFCYTEVKPPEEALDYFAALSDHKAVYLAVLDKLGKRYFMKEQWAPAANVYRKILSLSRNPDRNVDVAEKLFACAQNGEDLQRPEENVRVLVKTLEEVESSWRIAPEEKERLHGAFEVYARDMATKLHLQAREHGDRERFSRAADAYAYYLEFFQEDTQARAILENYTEALYEGGRFYEAALAYERLAGREDGSPEDGDREQLYGVVASFYKALKEEEGLTDLQKLEAREGLRQAGSSYLTRFPQAEQAPEVAFNVAWVSYEQGDYGAALEGFKTFVAHYPSSKEALAAGHLVLDIHKSLDDLDGLIADARELLDNTAITDTEFRKDVEGILMAAEHRHLEELTVKVKDGAEGSSEALLALGKEARDSGLQEMALFNLFVVSKEAEDIPKILEMGGSLLREFPATEHKGDVLATLAHFYFEAADFPRAAAFSEKAAETATGAARTEHLLRAARLHGWMGHPVAAVNDYRRCLPDLKAAQRLEAEQDLVDQLEALEDWANVAARCKGLMAQEAESAEWLYRYGNALYEQGRRQEALEVFGKVAERFAAKVASSPESLTPEERAFAAQARFRLAERELNAYRKIAFRGGKIDNAVIQKKVGTLQQVETAGLEVAQYASPRWTIASLELAAQANLELVRFFMEAPMPEGLNLAQKQQYRQLLEDKVRPYREKAHQYRSAALEKAHGLGIFCPEALACYAAFHGGAAPPGIERSRLMAGRASGETAASPDDILQRLHPDPANGELLKTLAMAYAEAGEKDTAVLVLHRCMEKNPEDAGCRNLLGLVQVFQGEDQQARASFQEALEMDAGLDAARANLVVLYEGYGNVGEARTRLAQIRDRGALGAGGRGVHPGFAAAAGRLSAVALHDAPVQAEAGQRKP